MDVTIKLCFFKTIYTKPFKSIIDNFITQQTYKVNDEEYLHVDKETDLFCFSEVPRGTI